MRNRIGLILLSLFAISLIFPISSVYAAERMTFEEYQRIYTEAKNRESDFLSRIASEEEALEQVRSSASKAMAAIDETWNQIFSVLAISEADYKSHHARIDELEGHLAELAGLTPDKLLERADELDRISDEIEKESENPANDISYAGNRLEELKARVGALKRVVPKPKNDIYDVVRGDCLWIISGKSEIYSDPFKWLRIWSANRHEIRDPDLIYPDQRLRVPRQIGRDQHIIQRGEYLSKIASYPEVYGDPFQWTKIYQANKAGQFLQDPNLVYPEQILTIPPRN